MYLFVGDSHSRQFQSDMSGKWAFVSFSGATIRGLASNRSKTRHGEAIKHLAMMPFPKTMLIMLGSVDLDATFYRQATLGKLSSEARFFDERAEIYVQFLERLHWAAGEHLSNLCVLAPQITPLGDGAFPSITAQMADVSEEALVAAGNRIDCSHRARCRRQIAFNDILEAAVSASNVASFHRIDQLMTTDGEMIDVRFFRKNPKDHHALSSATMPLWHRELRHIVRPFEKLAKRHEQAAIAAVAREVKGQAGIAVA